MSVAFEVSVSREPHVKRERKRKGVKRELRTDTYTARVEPPIFPGLGFDRLVGDILAFTGQYPDEKECRVRFHAEYLGNGPNEKGEEGSLFACAVTYAENGRVEPGRHRPEVRGAIGEALGNAALALGDPERARNLLYQIEERAAWTYQLD